MAEAVITRYATCRLLGLRVQKWPRGWPLPSGAQFVMLRALLKERPNAFVAAVDPITPIYRVVVLGGRCGGREYVVLTDGRMRHVQAGVPYEAAA